MPLFEWRMSSARKSPVNWFGFMQPPDLVPKSQSLASIPRRADLLSSLSMIVRYSFRRLELPVTRPVKRRNKVPSISAASNSIRAEISCASNFGWSRLNVTTAWVSSADELA
jgi:hypothetical protein